MPTQGQTLWVNMSEFCKQPKLLCLPAILLMFSGSGDCLTSLFSAYEDGKIPNLEIMSLYSIDWLRLIY
jgi:hypothetical protein